MTIKYGCKDHISINYHNVPNNKTKSDDIIQIQFGSIYNLQMLR